MTYNAVDLVHKWKSLVNDNINIGRDSSLVKKALEIYTPEQILHGIYQYRNNNTISIPQFLRQSEDWLEDNEQEAEILLAMDVSNRVPSEWYIYNDMSQEENADAYQQAMDARLRLREWARRVLA